MIKAHISVFGARGNDPILKCEAIGVSLASAMIQASREIRRQRKDGDPIRNWCNVEIIFTKSSRKKRVEANV